MYTSLLLKILRDQREELDSLRSQCFYKRKEEDLIKLESKKAQVMIDVRRRVIRWDTVTNTFLKY